MNLFSVKFPEEFSDRYSVERATKSCTEAKSIDRIHTHVIIIFVFLGPDTWFLRGHLIAKYLLFKQKIRCGYFVVMRERMILFVNLP